MAGFSVPIFQWLLTTGQPNAAGKIYVYQTGTTTTVNIYSDNNLTTPISNPLTLDANGESKFYVANTINLRIDSYDVNGGFIQSVDPVFPVGSTSNIAGTTVYKSASFNITAANIGQNIVSTTAINVNLPLTNTFNNYSQITFNAQGGAITLIPQSSEKFLGQTTGASLTIPQGGSGELFTDALGNWGLNFSAGNGVLTASSLTFTSTSGIIGTTTNNNAANGSVGEYIAASANGGSSTVTITIATPAVVTWTGHSFPVDSVHNFAVPIVFSTTGALPTGITAGTTYYVIGSTVTSTTFQIATSIANAISNTAIATSGTQSGTQTANSSIPLTSGTTTNMCAISLTAGDWEVYGATQFVFVSGSILVTSFESSISATLSTLDMSADRYYSFSSNGINQGSGFPYTAKSGPTRVSLSATTIYYLIGRCYFSSGSESSYGIISARRIR